MAKFGAIERCDLHFALGHLGDAGPFELRAGRRRYVLTAHTPQTLARHSATNLALGALPLDARASFTHYAEGVELPATRTILMRVVWPAPSGSRALPRLAALAMRTPRDARRAHRRRKYARTKPWVLLLERFAIASPSAADEALAISLDADDLIGPPDTAAALVAAHPQLASVDPGTAAIVMDDHIQAPANALNVDRFGAAIARQGPNWATTANSTDHNGNALTFGPYFKDQAGQPVQTYKLSASTVSAAGTPLALPLATSQDDPQLRNACWSSTQGIGSVAHDGAAASATARLARRPRARALGVGDPSADFTLDNLTPGYGLDVDDSSLVFTPDPSTPGAGTLSINVTNTYLRSLWAWVQFYDPSGNSLGPWQSLDLVSPVNVVLGIPMPTDPTTLSFSWNPQASRAVLAHGGLGTSDWNNDIVWPGVLLTGIFNYGIPVLFLLIGAELDSNAWLKEIEEEKPLLVTIIKDGTSILGSLETNAIGFPNIKTILSAFADGMAGILVHAGLEDLQAYVVEELGEAALEDAIPYVDIFFEIANRAVDLVEIGETTVEVLTSPATYTLNIQRSMPLDVTVSPDPTHGSPSNPAVWPLDSDHYVTIVQYQGGTSYTTTGPMLGSTSSQPIAVTFASIPEGGMLQVQFSVYSADDTLLGRWTSAKVAALRPSPGATLALSGAIQESLVPLTASTIYNYKQKLVYAAAVAAHAWQANQFAMAASTVAPLDAGEIDATVRQYFQANGCTLSSAASVQVVTSRQAWNIVDGAVTYILSYSADAGGEVVVNTDNAPLAVLPLDTGDTGNNLGALAGITINDRAYMVGYCWMASGQNVPAAGTTQPPITSQINTFQNVNVLAAPDAALKFSGVGFANAPFIVYDQFGPVPLFSVSSDFVSDLDGGSIPAALATLFGQFAYALPQAGASVTTVTSGVEWTIDIDGSATYSLLAAAGQIDVYPYPAVVVSQNNFYLEPTSTDPDNYQYQLRQIVLDDTTPFDMNQAVSFGQFLLPHLNDVVVHPQGYVIGAHANLNMLEILQLPAQPSPDAQAMPAVFVGGTGTRPGLFGGPVALAVTADGRVLVLEQQNARIQALDVNGNPVACFAAATLPNASADNAAALDAGLVSTNLRAAFAAANAPLSSVWRVQDATAIYQLAAASDQVVVTSGGASLSTAWTVTDSSTTSQVFALTLNGSAIDVATGSNPPLFSVAATVAASLDAGTLGSTLAAAFQANGVTLVAPIQVAGNLFTLDPSVLADLAQGNVPATLTSGLAARNITLGTPAAVTASVAVSVVQSQAQWRLVDKINNTTYGLACTAAGSPIGIVALAPTMPLRPPPQGVTPVYASVATETKGYIYVLSYAPPGNDIANFTLDIYRPDGTWLTQTGSVNAGDIALDMWRNLYTLNFESFLGPNGRTEPSVSVWTPSI